MAYPSVNGPYGLIPVKLISGVPFVGVTREYKIASGYGTSIFNGDAVTLVVILKPSLNGTQVISLITLLAYKGVM
jgi:hypothetical protein